MPRALAVLCLLLVACGYQDVPAAFDWDSPEPLTALPPCDPPPPPSGDPVPPGAVLPPGAVVTDVMVQDPLTTVSGYVELTPIGIRLDYQERDGGDVGRQVFEPDEFAGQVVHGAPRHGELRGGQHRPAPGG